MLHKRYILLGVGIYAALSWYVYNMKPTPRDRAVRFCEPCGLTAPEVDRLIDDLRAVDTPAEVARSLWEQTYSDPAELEAAREVCGDCVEAVVGATGA